MAAAWSSGSVVPLAPFAVLAPFAAPAGVAGRGEPEQEDQCHRGDHLAARPCRAPRMPGWSSVPVKICKKPGGPQGSKRQPKTRS